MNENPEIQSAIDEEHLRLLSLGYKITAGVTLFYSLIGLVYMLMGIILSRLPMKGTQQPEFPVFWFFGLFGFGFFVYSVIFAWLNYLTARKLQHKKSKSLCTVVAALNCMGFPYHTVLGVFTLVVLSRKSVALLFEQNKN